MADSSNNIQPYPYMFDPSQFANPYTSWNKMALPFMGQMAANTPTDAHGNPIASYGQAQAAHDAWAAANPAPAQGTTLNSNPNQGLEAQGTAARAMQDMGYGDWAMLEPDLAQSNNPNQKPGPGSVGYQEANYDKTGPQMMTLGQNGLTPANGSGGQQTQQTNPIDMSHAYLQALANPGKVTTPGATVPQAAPPSNQSGVLQQFLQNWQQGGGNTQGAGNYNNAGFYKALQGQV